MNYFFLFAKILLGVVLVLAYPLVLQPLAVSLYYKSIQRVWRTRSADTFMLLVVSLALLLLPFLIPRFLPVVRLFYAAMAIILIQKVVSYLREHGWPWSLVEPQHGYVDFMHSCTINYSERPEPLEEGEETPSPTYLRWRAALHYAVVAAAIVLNVTMGIWRYTPPLAATLAKVLLCILAFHATQDVLNAGLIKKGLKPDIVLIDLRLFWSRTYELCVLRMNPITYRWLLRYVYLPLGGKNHPLRNILACYLASGLWHEYALSIASMKVSGLWCAYFTLNGLIVCVEGLLRNHRERFFERLGEGTVRYRMVELAMSTMNFALNVCVAHLLFLGLDQVIRFH